jgi:hypothetical protein
MQQQLSQTRHFAHCVCSSIANTTFGDPNLRGTEQNPFTLFLAPQERFIRITVTDNGATGHYSKTWKGRVLSAYRIGKLSISTT